MLPLLARNVYMQGYQQGTPTEYLILLDRYVQQARELQILAGSSKAIRVRAVTMQARSFRSLDTEYRDADRRLSIWRPLIRREPFLRSTQASLLPS